MNHLYYGDNLDVLRNGIPDDSVDLIYLDPPFNSNASYNVLFKGPKGGESPAQIEAFDDTWVWNDLTSGQALVEVKDSAYQDAAKMLDAMVGFLGKNAMTAYLCMMGVRLTELHRVLKPTGSLYLHCDPTAGHYLKILIDAVFGSENYRNEITWKRTTAHSDGSRWGRNTDTIFFYTKSNTWFWKPVFSPYDQKYLSRFRYTDPDGRKWMDDNATAKGLTGGGYEYDYKGAKSLWRFPYETMEKLDQENRLHFTKNGGIRIKRYLDEAKGMPAQALWDDIPPINARSKERLGYPTQKPVALLERIINASSNPGDTVLDPFCGCGTTVHAAQKLNRRWIGIDITPIAITLIKSRLSDAFGGDVAYTTQGLPKDIDGARMLFADDDRTKKKFEMWAVGLIEAYPQAGGKKGADGGIDGTFWFGPDKSCKAIVSVKGGKNVGVAMIRELDAVVTREKADLGVFLTLEAPTRPMIQEAAQMGTVEVEGFSPRPRMQIVTIKEALENGAAAVDAPLRHGDTYKAAPRETDQTKQGMLDV